MVNVETQVGPLGAATITDLVIDDDKNWQDKKIKNLGKPDDAKTAAQLIDAMLWGL